MTELWRYSAAQQAALIRQREVSSRELVQAHLDRIQAVNPLVNAVTVTLADTALAAADRADSQPAQAPLHGVPFTVKENIDCVGSATTQGLVAFAEMQPELDAPVVERMKAAGGIPIARTNLPEMGLRIDTANPLRGRTQNPWSKTRTAGGSSGGEAAAIATGMSPIGLGNDIGGSLRNPAHCCGISSLKPTLGRIPHASSLAPLDGGYSAQQLLMEGPMARSVGDVKLGYEVLAGWHWRDPMSVPAELNRPLLARKAALVTALPGTPIESSVVSAIEAAGEALQAAGWQVAHVSPPALESVQNLWAQIMSVDIAMMLPLLQPLMDAQGSTLLAQFAERYPPDAVSGYQLVAERAGLMRAWSEFFQAWPVVVGPVWPGLPFEHDADLDVEHGADLVFDTLRFITPGNALGIPSVCVPFATDTSTADALPIGVQLYADRFCEGHAFAAAEVLEQASSWVLPFDPAR